MVGEISKAYGIVGFVASLVALIGLLINVYFGIVLAIISLIFCIIQFKKGKTGLAIAGLVISIIAIVFGIILVLIWEVFISGTLESGTEEINKKIAGLT